MRLKVIRSPRKMGASRQIQAGEVNSSANTVASGSTRTPIVQPYWAARWIAARAPCAIMCLG
jgi:hypothetical protein